MSKKVKIIICVAVLIVVILLIIVGNEVKKDKSKTSNLVKNEAIKYDEGNMTYTITDKNGNEHSAYSEEGAYVYTIDPDYDSGNPDERSPYDYYEENEVN